MKNQPDRNEAVANRMGNSDPKEVDRGGLEPPTHGFSVATVPFVKSLLEFLVGKTRAVESAFSVLAPGPSTILSTIAKSNQSAG